MDARHERLPNSSASPALASGIAVAFRVSPGPEPRSYYREIRRRITILSLGDLNGRLNISP